MSRELILAVSAALFLIVAIIAIQKINRLNISTAAKAGLYYVAVFVPILGLFLAWRAGRKPR